MKTSLRIEELIQWIICYLVTLELDHSWWLFWALIITPDIGMIGYVISPKAGAFTYNLFHHKGIALLVVAFGYYTLNDWVLFAGILLYGHSAMDRFFGYGLKYSDDFKHTHLGMIGGSGPKA